MSASTPHDNLIRLLDENQVAYRIHAHPPSITFQDAARLHFPLDHLLKTVAFGIKGRGWVLTALRGADRVDYKKLAALLGVNRTKIAALTPHQIAENLGYPIGGVAPFATNPQTQVILDARILPLERIFYGAGRNDRTLEISPTDLLRLNNAWVADIAATP